MPSNTPHPETLALHAGWRADPATGAVAVPIYQTTSLPVPRRRARREPVRAQGAGQHLHPHHEPDDGGAGGAARGARGGRRGARGRVRAVGLADGGAEPRPRRRQHRELHRPLRRHLEPVREHDEGPRDRDPLRRSRATPRRSRAPPTTAPAPITPRRCPTRSSRCSRSREVAAIGRRFGIPLIMDNTAAPLIARPFEHGAAVVMYSLTKYCGGHGNSIGGVDHRRRQFRLGGARRAPAGAEHARPELSRRGMGRGGEAARADRLHPQGAGDAAARPRRRAVAVQHLSVPPGDGDAAAADAAALRECDAGRRVPRSAARGGAGDPSRLQTGRDARARGQIPARRLRRPGRLRAEGRHAGRAGASSTRCNCSTTSPISATRAASRSIRRAPPTRNSPTRRSGRRVSPTAMCASRSASSTSTTSWPISIAGWRLRGGSCPRRRR